MLNKMIIVEVKNCRVCMSPLFGILEMVVIIVLLKTVTGMSTPGLYFADFIIISFLILTGSLCSLFIHEYAHALAARQVDLPIKEITVSFCGAHTLLDREPLQPKEALLVSVAGPLANIFAGIILYAGHLAFSQSDILGTVFFCLSVFNGILSIYNLMPVMPLDGGMIVRSALWLVSGNWTWSTRRALLIGNGFAVLCVIAGITFILIHHSIMCVVLSILGLSFWQSEKSAYERLLAAKILNVVPPKDLREEVMKDAVR